MASTPTRRVQTRRPSGRHQPRDGSSQLPLEWLDTAVRAAEGEARRISSPRKRGAGIVPPLDHNVNPEEDGRLLKVPDVARVLQIGRRQAWELVWRGELPSVRIGQRSIRVTRADLDRYIDEHRGPYGA